MDKGQFLQRIEHAFSKELPGISAHQKLTPLKRPLIQTEIEDLEMYRFSAVSIVCFEEDNRVKSVLIQRQEYEGNHSGQVSFSGGKKDVSDKSLLETAIRETSEEIGWKLRSDSFLGEMTEVFIPISKFRMTPFVFFLKSKQNFVPNEREVAEIIIFDLEELLKPDAIQTIRLKLGSGVFIPEVPHFMLANKLVWGATAVVLGEFREMLLELQAR